MTAAAASAESTYLRRWIEQVNLIASSILPDKPRPIEADTEVQGAAFTLDPKRRCTRIVAKNGHLLACGRVDHHGRRSSARDRTIRMVKALGRRRWKREAGYQRQARAENAFFRYKSIIGDGLRARTPGGRVAEALLACNLLNQMTALGRPESYGIGR